MSREWQKMQKHVRDNWDFSCQYGKYLCHCLDQAEVWRGAGLLGVLIPKHWNGRIVTACEELQRGERRTSLAGWALQVPWAHKAQQTEGSFPMGIHLSLVLFSPFSEILAIFMCIHSVEISSTLPRLVPRSYVCGVFFFFFFSPI